MRSVTSRHWDLNSVRVADQVRVHEAPGPFLSGPGRDPRAPDPQAHLPSLFAPLGSEGLPHLDRKALWPDAPFASACGGEQVWNSHSFLEIWQFTLLERNKLALQQELEAKDERHLLISPEKYRNIRVPGTYWSSFAQGEIIPIPSVQQAS